MCTPYVEIQWIKIKLTKSRPFYLAAIYRLPDGSIVEFLESLEEQLLLVSDNVESEWVLLGDINIDTLVRSRTVKSYSDFMHRHSLKSLITIPTHLNRFDIPMSCLDHILINHQDFYVNYDIAPVNVSDHLPIFCFRKRAEKPKDFVWLDARSYKNFTDETFAERIRDQDWSDCLNATDVETAWISFRDAFISILDDMAPFKKNEV